MEGQVEEWLMKKYEDQIVRIERQRKEDLKLVGFLSVVMRAVLTTHVSLIICLAIGEL